MRPLFYKRNVFKSGIQTYLFCFSKIALIEIQSQTLCLQTLCLQDFCASFLNSVRKNLTILHKCSIVLLL